MHEPLDDFEALVSRAVEGEVGALAQLLAGQQVWLTEFVSTRLDRRLSARLDVGDIVQEVLVEAAGKLPDYLARSPIPFTAWIKQIAIERMTSPGACRGRQAFDPPRSLDGRFERLVVRFPTGISPQIAG